MRRVLSRRVQVAGVACSLLVLVGCMATAPRTEIAIYSAPGAPELAEIRSMAVEPFDRDRDDMLTKALEALIANTTLADRTQSVQRSVAVVGVERTRSLSTRSLAPPSVAQSASSLGVDAFLRGEVAQAATVSTPYQRSRSECARTVVQKDRKGRDVTQCTETRQVPVACVKNTATVAVNYQVVDKSGRINARQTVTASSEDHACEGKRVQIEERALAGIGFQSVRELGGPITPLPELLASAMAMAARQIRDQIVPQQKTISVEWLSGTDGIRDAAAKEKFSQALKFLGGRRPDRACELFREAFVAEKQSAALHYNVGLCDETEGQLEAALRNYVTADKMLTAPNAAVSSALARTRDQVRTIESLAARRPDLLDAPAVPRVGSARVENPIAAQVAGIDPKLLAAMKQERRVALVIGNGRYRNVAALRNAVNDAQDVEKALKDLSFNVISGYDLTHQQTLEILNRFRANLRPNDVGLIYFAGHGISIENSNFLLPVDFQPALTRTAQMTRSRSIDMEQTLVRLMRQAKVRFSMVVADACREVPQIEASTRSLSRGLAAPKTVAAGTMIIYAAGAGQTADDGEGRNGLFTSKFLEAIRTPNVNIKQAMDWVASAVSAKTDGQQIPSVYAELTGEFYFALSDTPQ